ncbi:MAG: hypothetical protein H0Z19_11790 [Archaeoglobus sp.]|uniref:hypothetical protein n=1 Tax=Archaeoglobus sp. TaxID=1872626 RepID=UPI001D64C8EA|nr:hypothetical protein [Archaeoglobus sp.]MBO8181130.1 hypothetical protein [Archaeoglobus sp.]
MPETITLLDVFGGGKRNTEEQQEIEWVRFDQPDIAVEGRVTFVNAKWDEERNRRRATVILETEDGKRLGISGTWTTFVRLITKSGIKKDDRIRLHYRGTLAQLEVTEPDYANAFKQAYESYMLWLKRRGRNIRFTKPPAGTKIFDMEVLYRAPEPEETGSEKEEVKAEIENIEA